MCSEKGILFFFPECVSKYLSPKLVVSQAWDITRQYKRRLFWYGFIPALLGMLVGTVYVLYQVVAFREYFYGDVEYREIIEQALGFLLADGTPTLLLIGVVILVLIGYVTVPIFCKCSLVFLVEKILKKEDLEAGVRIGFMRFMPMFEFGALKNAISPTSFLSQISFALRNLGGFFQLLIPVFVVLMVFGVVGLFFFAYVPQVIVLQRKTLMEAVSASTRLTFRYFSETLRLFLLLLLIELRVLVNIAIILFLPVGIVTIMGLFGSAIWLQGIGILVSGVVGIVLICAAAFISGVLEIFSTAIWTIAFHTLTPDEEKQTEV